MFIQMRIPYISLEGFPCGCHAAEPAAEQESDSITGALKRLCKANEGPFRNRVHINLISQEYDQVIDRPYKEV